MKSESVKSALVVRVALTTTLGIMGTAAAQTEGGSASSVEEIIVTARRVEERLQDVPISISVVTQEQLNNRNVTNAVDLAAYIPSLSVNNAFGNENASFAIRGFVQDAGTPPSVGTYFADVVAPRGPTQGTQAGDGVGPGSFFDLQNLQVLKGPQGTLFGRNTTGGAILLVPQKPTADFEGYAEASAGNYNMRRMQGALNVPVSDAMRFRLAADHQTRDGYVHNISGIGPSDYNDVDYTAVRASLVVDITPNIENYTIGSYSKSRTNGSVQKLIACNSAGLNPPYDEATIAAGVRNFIGLFSCSQLAAERARGAGFYDVQTAEPNPVSRLEQRQIINTTTWNLSDQLTIKNIASYAEFKDFQRAELFATNWQLSTLPLPYQGIFSLPTTLAGISPAIPATFANIVPPPGLQSADQSTYTEELQLQGSAAGQRLTYQAGIYFEWSDPLAPVGNQSPGLVTCADSATFNCSDPLGITLTTLTAAQLAGLGFPPPYPAVNVGSVNYTVGRTTFRGRGIYTQSSYAVTDQWKLTGGVRYTWDEHSNDSTRITYTFPVVAPFTAAPTPRCTDLAAAPTCSQHLEKESQKLTWLIGLDYKPIEDVLIYAKYARGYRAGGIYPNAPIDYRTFDPEELDNYEVGLKSIFRGAVPVTFNVAAFYNDFSNQQIQAGFNTAPGSTSTPTGAIANAGKSRIYGTEVDVSITPAAGLTLEAAYAYLNTKLEEVATVTTVDPNYFSDSPNIEGLPLALSPKNKFTLTGTYTLPLDSNIGLVSLGVTYLHTDKQLVSYVYQQPGVVAAMGSDNTYISSRDLLNANVGWDSIAGTAIDLSVFGTNLTNKQYFDYIGGVASSGVDTATLGAPRTYGVKLRYRFGAR